MERLFISFDTETTGLRKCTSPDLNTPAAITARGDEMIQIGGLILNNDMKPTKLFCHYCDTVLADSSEGALNVHGISQRNIRDYLLCKYPAEVMHEYLPEFFYDDVIFLGYNVEYDMSMVAQSLANSPGTFEWKKARGSIVPKHGRYSINVADFVMNDGKYQKLSTFVDWLEPYREQFFNRYSHLKLQTNCIELLSGEWEKAHNSFFDALNTYLIWGEKVWKKKVI